MYKKCKICDKEFYARPSWVEKGRAKFCSRECYGQYQATSDIKRFDIVQWWKENPEKRKEANEKKKGREAWNKGKKLGFTPKNAFKKGQNMGVNHPKWSGGSWLYWRKKALERDKYSCQCNNKCPWHEKKCLFSFKGIMEVDHIKPRANGGTHEINNLQTLCPNCHNFKTFKIKPKQNRSIKILSE